MSIIQKTIVTCDACERDISEAPHQRHLLADGGKPLVLDLCEKHDKAMTKALDPWLAMGTVITSQAQPTTKSGRRRAKAS